MLCQGERAILETRFRYPGKFMFHAHQSEFAELGWMGLFESRRCAVTPEIAAPDRPARAAIVPADPRSPRSSSPHRQAQSGRAPPPGRDAAGGAADDLARDARVRRHPPVGPQRRPRPGHHRAGHRRRRLLVVHEREAATRSTTWDRTTRARAVSLGGGRGAPGQDADVDRHAVRARDRGRARDPASDGGAISGASR